MLHLHCAVLLTSCSPPLDCKRIPFGALSLQDCNITVLKPSNSKSSLPNLASRPSRHEASAKHHHLGHAAPKSALLQTAMSLPAVSIRYHPLSAS
eukprot:6032266-Amphidinium_carterae.1